MYTAMMLDQASPQLFVDPSNSAGLFMGDSRYYNKASFEIDDTYPDDPVALNVFSVDQFQTDVEVNNGTVTGIVYLYGKESR